MIDEVKVKELQPLEAQPIVVSLFLWDVAAVLIRNEVVYDKRVIMVVCDCDLGVESEERRGGARRVRGKKGLRVKKRTKKRQ